MTHYYIEHNGTRDGPHDLITIMRRIRVGTITPDTPIYTDHSTHAMPARDIAEIADFFETGTPAKNKPHTTPLPSLEQLLHNGWQMVMEHNIITVYAGAFLLLGLMLTVALSDLLGFYTGNMLAWCVLLIFYHIFVVCVLRLQRGQAIGLDFIDHQIAPVIGTLIVTSIILALMMAGGLLLLVIPGLWVIVSYSFVPFLILEKRMGMVQAMQRSRVLLARGGNDYRRTLMQLLLLHLICMVLILPIPLTLPIFATALSELYEKLSER